LRILSLCYITFFKKLIPYPKSRKDLIPFMLDIKNSSTYIKESCWLIAQNIKKETYEK